MSLALSAVAFLVISFLGMKYAFLAKTYRVKSPFTTGLNFRVSSRQHFILLLLCTAIVQAGSFSAILLLVWMVLLLQLTLKYGTRFSVSPVFFFYALYLSWLLFSLLLTPEPAFGFRVFAKYAFPFLVLLVVAKTPIHTTFFLKAVKISFWAALTANLIIGLPLILPIGFLTGPIFNPILWWGPAILDFNPFAIAIVLSLYSLTKKRRYLVVIFIFVLIPILTANRTGLVGIGVCLLAMSWFKYKVRALPIMAMVLALFISAIVFIPGVRDKMFYESYSNADTLLNDSNTISKDAINSNGRFAMWEWSLENFYTGNKAMGSGLGQIQAVFYGENHPFGDIRIIHNDYVQILCDTGLIGLMLYLLISLSFVLHAFKIYINKKNQPAARYAAFIAGTSLCGIMACAFTDNVINYSLITLSYPYVFFGFSLSLKNNSIKKNV